MVARKIFIKRRGGESAAIEAGGLRAWSNMNNIDCNALTCHLSEQQLVDYVQQEMAASDLQRVNSHLVECRKCAEQLSSLILFAAENQLLKFEQEKVIDRFLTSADYNLLKDNFVDRAIESYKRRRSRILKRINGISLKLSFNIRLTS